MYNVYHTLHTTYTVSVLNFTAHCVFENPVHLENGKTLHIQNYTNYEMSHRTHVDKIEICFVLKEKVFPQQAKQKENVNKRKINTQKTFKLKVNLNRGIE